jgi:hypothetical protein
LPASLQPPKGFVSRVVVKIKAVDLHWIGHGMLINQATTTALHIFISLGLVVKQIPALERKSPMTTTDGAY